MIDKLEKAMKRGETCFNLLMAVKLLSNEFLSRIGFSIVKYFFSDVWNKSVSQVLDDLGFGKNKEEYSLIASIIFANLGDSGKYRCSNSFAMFSTLFYHYQAAGGYYIEGGPSEVTRAIMPTIEKAGGRCLANMRVESIIFDDKKTQQRAIGVIVNHKGKEFKYYARRGIISSAGFKNTFGKLIKSNDLLKFTKNPKNTNMNKNKIKFDVNKKIESLDNSQSHFQCFVGLNKGQKELNLPTYNIWTLRGFNKTYSNYDEMVKEFHNNPLNTPIMGFIGFPSAKDPKFALKHGENKSSCVIVTELPRKHFSKYENEPCGGRSKEYEELKGKIGEKLVEELLFKQFPQTRDCVEKIKYGTPLTTEYYLGSFEGESYGLHNSMERYFDYNTLKHTLNCQTGIKGLYLTGQDTVSCGFAGAIAGGQFCAMQILGYNTLSCLLANRSLIKDIEKLDAKNQS